MADALQTQLIPNMIQGVSQQVAQQRRDTQCEAQFDCFNDPVEGCRARTSAELVAFLAGKHFENAYVFDIERSSAEHYAVIVTAGDLKVYDLADGTECSVTFPDGKAYLATTASPKNIFTSTIVDDYSFVANKGIIPAMGTTTSPARPKEAMLYFKAGAYSMTFTVSLTFGGTTYGWSYKTPDNSVSGNADYIATNQLAATFYRAMVGAGGVAASGPTLTSLGFTVGLLGSVVHIYRTDGQEFSLGAGDGAGDTYVIPLKDSAKAFSYLPAKAIEGFCIKVKGSDASRDDDYWVTYKATGGGYWEETVAPGIAIGLDPATMPWQLKNTAYRTFVFGKAPWGARVAGDSESAKTPSFVGRAIQDLFSDHSRLGLVVEPGAVWSKSRNPYVFFPDTVQTILGTAPIDYTVMGGKRIALFRRLVQADESTFLWAQKAQFRVTSGSDPFKQDTIEAKVSASYEFAEACAPEAVGSSLYFVTEPGEYAAVRDLLLSDGKIRGESNVTRHVPKYIPSGVTRISGSDTLEMLLAFSEATPSRLYAYNWVIDGQNRVQSAWNTLRLPSGCSILWFGIFSSKALMLAQRGDGVAILSMDLASNATDPGESWHTRADLRITADALVGSSYDASTNRSTLVAPFAWSEALPEDLIVAVRTTNSGGYARGYVFRVISISGPTVVVSGDVRDHELYIGLRISSEREESEFFVRTDKGITPSDGTTVYDYTYSHAKTGYYKAIVTESKGRVWTHEFTGRVIGSVENQLDAISLDTGQFQVPIRLPSGGFKLRLVNDSHLPSAWQSATVHYQMTARALGPARG